MINGITVKFGGDQAKLMENLSKSVTGSPKGVYSGKGQPKEDLLKAGKDFATVIPTGFLVLHKDLQELIKGGGGKKGSGLGDLTNMLPTMFAAVGAVAIAGMVVAGLFGSMSPKSGNHISELVDELNGRLTVDDLANDPEVLEAQHKGVAMYIKSFFIAQAADAVITATLGAVGSGAGKALSGMVNGLLGKETKSDAELHLKELIDNIILKQSPDDWQPGGQYWDDTLQKEVGIGIKTYLGLWFAAQAASMTVETLAAGVGGAIGGAITSLISSFSKKETAPTAVDHLKSIIDSIIMSQKPEDWQEGGKFYGPALETEISIGIRTYLGLWFAAQAVAITAEELGKGVGKTIAGVFTGIFSGFGGKPANAAASEHLKDIIDNIILAQQKGDWAPGGKFYGPALETEVSIGIRTYLGLWFAAQAVSMTAEEIGKGAGETIGKVFTGLLNGFGLATPAAKASNHLKEVIDTIIIAQDPAKWAEEANTEGSSLQTEVKTGIQAYLAIWFAMQVMQLTVEKTSATVGSVAGSVAGGILSGLFHAVGVQSPLEQKINDIIDAIILGLDENDSKIADSEEVQDGVREGIGSYIKTYFQLMAVQAAAQKTGSDLGEKVGNAARKVWDWLTGNKTEESKKEDPMAILGQKLDTILVAVIGKVDPNKLSDDQYDQMIIEGISGFVSGYLASFADAADENKKAIKDLLKDDKDLSASVLNMYRKLFDNLSLEDNLQDIQKKIANKATSSILDTVEEIFKAEGKAIRKNYDSSLNYIQINNALATVSEKYLAAVKESLEQSFNVNASTTVLNKGDNSGIINALTTIQGQLNQLSTFVDEIKGNQGVMAGLYAASIPDGSGPAENAYSRLSGTEED